jgi:hypothetical protein
MLKNLKYWLQDKELLFSHFDNNVLDKDNKDKRRVFIDRDSKILFVAHLDTVQVPKFHFENKKCIRASGLDDRLGCLIASELSKELKTDLLLTDNEECERSTAKYHKCKQYNWIAEFDRHGDDVVTYDLDSDKFLKELRKIWTVGSGSMSDICYLDTNACCVNIGIGFEHDHSPDSFARIKTIKRQIDKFKMFFAKHKDTEFIRDERIYNTPLTYPKMYYPDSCEDYQTEFCEICGIHGAKEVFGYDICEDCFLSMLYHKLGLLDETENDDNVAEFYS